LKVIILAAGQGKRLRPLTDDRPKCMVEYNGKAIIDYILQSMKKCALHDIAIVGGYKIDVLKEYLKDENIVFFENQNYESTNMVSTLFCADEWMDDDIIISYADIIYSDGILKSLINDDSQVSTAVDLKWLKLWSQRMQDPLSDAESMKFDANGNIVELGKKPKSYDDIEAQYMGLIKIKKERLGEIKSFYHGLDKDALYDGQSFDNMYMTSFLQMIIEKVSPVKAVKISGGWLEIDSISDLDCAAYSEL